MSQNNIKDIIEDLTAKLEKVLKKKRYRHTIAVCDTAANMAMSYGADIDKARIAGILHDCAKNIKGSELISLCREAELDIDTGLYDNSELLHAPYGAYLAEHLYHINDPDILNAIKWHTTGRPDMSILEKIIFVADYIEPWRDTAPNLSQIREIAYIDIDQCIVQICEGTLNYLTKSEINIDNQTYDTYYYYKNLKKE